jgi:transposase-like protein
MITTEGDPMKQRRRFSAEQKVRILREHLENQVKISQLSEQYGIHPTVLARWKKQLFEGALQTFSQTHVNRNGKTRQEERLENKIKQQREVIAEITTENLELRKKYFGET